ncbi:MAG TPA: PP2C family protein-serine/threonine phosphatase [Bryobacteraceae bacterium]|jgi:sigma-B regulation protein RsbU (phosphoserine phosphatase)|nr:PP2C family protein-serine/threonine phosphatase [Bryobacteraceae bacterium]
MSARRLVTLPRAFLALLILFVVLQWGIHATGSAILIFFPLVGTGATLSFRLIRKSIWRLRNRLYVTYVFIGVVPIVLILALTLVGTYIVTGQVAAYLVSAELQRRAAALVSPARALSEAKPSDRAAVAVQIGRILAQRMPHLEIVVAGDQTFHYPPDSKLAPPPAGWKDYTGNLSKSGVYYSAAFVKTGNVIAAALAPVDDDVLKNLVPGIGALRIGAEGPFAGTVPPAEPGWERLDFTTPWGNDLHLEDWDSPQSSRTSIFFVTTRPSAVLRTVFSNGLDTAQVVTFVFVALFVTLVLVQLGSWIIGISLTRTVTGAVHGLYEGTQRIAKGDFSWRIPVKGKDQLAELGKSFNNMTAQIENLVVIAKEKERLESEVEIAGEVQNQLFPRAVPEMRTIELVGVCQAARMVSGDYYDYLCLPDGNLALAIGDVAGKGISAALLMASIQSIMRTQLAAGLARSAAAGNGHSPARLSTSNMVAQLNRQLYANTAPEKYATFFFGVYEEQSGVLTYTNAGHLPPLLLRDGNSQRLEVTGTVVGAFPVSHYEEQTVQIQPGDMLIAYTDGITEPENAYGEEFGADRLSETALRYQNSEPGEVVARIMEAVAQWSAAPELPDDMTVIIAKGLR